MKNQIKLVLSLIMVLAIQQVIAQVKVKGKVLDEDSQGAVGANVVVKGTTIGVVTDLDGNFELTVPEGKDVLEISYVGYLKQDVPVESGKEISVQLEPDAIGIEEVVVTALGIKKEERNLTYAVKQVKGEDLMKARDNNVVNQLTGIAGVQVTNSSGSVGSSSRITLRGNTSISGSGNQPLFVVDGIPFDNRGSNNSVGAGVDYGNGASDINPEDIESISVLKGAAASALYGSRAASGVIIITTKTGKTGRKGLGVDYNFNVGFSNPLVLPKYQNKYGQGWESFSWGSERDGTGTGSDNVTEDYSWGAPFDGSPVDQFNGKGLPWEAAPSPLENFFETGINMTNNIAVTSNSEKLHARLSYTNNNQKGMMPNTDLTKNILTMNTGITLDPKTSVQLQTTYTKINSDNRAGTGYGTSGGDYNQNPLNGALWHGRQVNWEDLKEYEFEDGFQRNWNYSYWDNPYWILNKNLNGQAKDRLTSAATLNYKLNDWISFRGKIMNDFSIEERSERRAIFSVDFPNGAYWEQKRVFSETNLEAMLTINKAVSETLDIDAFVGGNRRINNINTSSVNVAALIVPDIYSTGNALGNPTGTTYRSQRDVQSVFANVGITYDRWLNLTLTARNDWSSTLPEDNNSYFYPSISGAFIISELTELPEWWDFAKVSASYSQVGLDGDPYSILPTYGTGTPINSITPTYMPSSIPNSLLENELTKSIEAGIDVRFAKNRIGLNASVYKANTFNQIIPLPVAPSSGASSRWINAGNIQNKGVEVELYGDIVRQDELKWTANVNIASNQSEVIDLDTANGVDTWQIASTYGTTVVAEVGQPFGVIRGDGFLRTQDDARNIIVGSNGVPMTAPEKMRLGTINPKMTLGFRNTVTYKDVSLSFLIDMKMGGSFISTTEYMGRFGGVLEETATKDRDAWVYDVDGAVKDNGDGTYSPNDIPVDQWGSGHANAYQLWSGVGRIEESLLHDAGYIKLRDLSIGYKLPSSITEKAKLQGATISFYGRNLAILKSDFVHGDPEVAMSSGDRSLGYEFLITPSARTLGISLNVKL